MTGIEPLLVPVGVWAWEYYGKDAVAWLVKRLAKHAEDIKEAGWERVDWVRASRTYRQELQRLYGSMQIFGMNRPVPLTDIFTDIYLLDKPSAWRRHAIEELRARAQTQPAEINTEKRYNGVDLVQSEPRLFVLGQPGAGKTTFLKYLVTQAITGKLDAIPVFVSLKAWSDANIDLLPFLVRQFTICGFPDAQPFVERILEEGKAIVLFDGLDEVNLEDNARQRITTAIRECAQQYGSSRMVITCRTAATEYVFEQFRYCELADFTHAQIEAFVARWFHDNEIKREAFLNAFAHEDHKGLRDLARRPLLLTMLCLTFEETMSFPRRRAELYEEAIDALLKKWDSARSIQRDTIYHKLSLGYKRQLLMELAAETFERGEFFMPKRDVVERTSRFLRRLPPMDITEDIDGEAVLHAIEAQHGLLIERARNIYSFSHLTFHEYFAARYIADHPEKSVLRGAITHAADPQWRETLLLTTSMLDYRNTETLFHIWCQKLQEQVQTDTILWSFIGAAQAIMPSSASIRANVLMYAVLDQAIISTQELISELDILSVLDFDLARALDVDFVLASEDARALDGDLARALGLALDLSRFRALERDHERDLALERACNINVSGASALALTGDPVYTSALKRARASIYTHNRILTRLHTLVQELSRIRDLCFQYQHLYSPSFTWDNRDLEGSKNWESILARLDEFSDYMHSTYCLLESLDIATVEDRASILDKLLILPSQAVTC
jgi:NACHT domain-containing protein